MDRITALMSITKEYLQSRNQPYTVHNSEVLYFDTALKSQLRQCRVVMIFTNTGIVTSACCPLKAAAAQYASVVDFILNVNNKRGATGSHFEFFYDDGSINAKQFLHCQERNPSTQLLAAHIYDTIQLLDDNGDALCALLNPSTQPQPQAAPASSRPSDFAVALVAAQRGDVKAKYYVGVCYNMGKDGAPKDPAEATRWLKAAASEGSADAMCYLGLRILGEEDGISGTPAEGVQYLTQAAQQGIVDAQTVLGGLYWAGDYVPRNQQLAIDYYEKAAQQNDTEAQFKLGLILQSEECFCADPARAAYWLERAATSGHMLAQRQLSVCYLMGNGVPEDTQKFLYWLEKAALQGDETAIRSLRNHFPNSAALAQIDGRTQPSPQPQPQPVYTPQPSSTGCYIATCVYGSYDCPPVWTLRRFRDDTLAAHPLGRLFIRTYYAVSPHLVRLFGRCAFVRSIWKTLLDRMVHTLNQNGVPNTPYED